jgi:hypothetical protein
LARPLTDACVAPFVEFCRSTDVNVEDELTCQLYAVIPAGSLTAVQEIVNGSVTLAPSAGEIAEGAGGAAATARAPALIHTIKANNSVRNRRSDVPNVINTPPMIDWMSRTTQLGRVFTATKFYVGETNAGALVYTLKRKRFSST